MTKDKKTVLVITDGIGYNSSDYFNAFLHAKKPNYDKMFETLPNSLLKTSGLSVGLPEGQMGNSEVGHMCIGSGRVLYQNLVKINKAIEDNTLKENKALNKLFSTCKNIHLVGLFSDGGVHSHIEHIFALVQIAKQQNKKVFIHALSDGRDVSPKAMPKYLEMFESIKCDEITLASVGGRFYAMDRDKRWERVKKAYDVMVDAKNKTALNPQEYISYMYEQDITDEFIEPACFGDYEGIDADDGVVMVNFRNDRARELTSALGEESFSEFEVTCRFKLITMTEYDANFSFDVMFESQKPKNTLAEVIAKNGLSQFHTAETEKYAHVTFFFNGGDEEPMENETRLLVPSPKVSTYDLQPQMSARKVCDGVLKAMKGGYDFIVVNFANGDMVGHTGDYEASIKAVESVDEQIGRILKASDEFAYNVLITSDHGNCEELKDENGKSLTNHTTYEVFCFLKAKGYESVKNGGLNNIAPTVLKLMDLPVPEEMSEALV
ncbi:MAG: 2,3-bisphosphoglycerate-independent phosphoglycerate mutase [Campylobacteraceae bacterium]|nr:2,3-bisphosphoglycerate-independent phosphoglycerate mutase [Campylobacteraceae bacterium]